VTIDKVDHLVQVCFAELATDALDRCVLDLPGRHNPAFIDRHRIQVVYVCVGLVERLLSLHQHF
jgi:hypothetical protein